MSVLVTGADGFIGQMLCRLLVGHGFPLRTAVRFSGGTQPAQQVVVGDIHGQTEWSEALVGVAAVVHLAAHVHARGTNEDQDDLYFQVNTEGTLNLARQAAAVGVRRLIFVSTIKVLGEGREEPYSEVDNPQPQDAYGLSKLRAEEGLRQIAAETGLEVCILRPPLVYGPGVRANFLQLLRWVDRGVPLPLAAVTNRRSLVAVGNLVDAIITCIDHPAAGNATFHVADGVPVSTPELIRKMSVALGRTPRLWPLPMTWLRAAARTTGQTERYERLAGSLAVDDSLIRARLGWRPPQSMEEALTETVAVYRAGRRAG